MAAARMKAIFSVIFVAGGLLLLASPVVFYHPIHDRLGLWNTSYSPKFTAKRFAQVSVGMPRSQVIELLGPPLDTHRLTNYPVWALSDERVRARYGRDSQLQIETLSFSRPKHSRDYDMVTVWIGPETNVIQHYRWVTD